MFADDLSKSLLHVRGGVSRAARQRGRWCRSSPRAWRCFSRMAKLNAKQAVFSTCVEVFPVQAMPLRGALSLLHVRGGVSVLPFLQTTPRRSSPRAWRCFSRRLFAPDPTMVFSTCVEVFPSSGVRDSSHVSLLHVRGGVSTAVRKYQITRSSSPRAWRCFRYTSQGKLRGSVFSTCVEVFLKTRWRPASASGLLHVRGGVSNPGPSASDPDRSSPRAWRCFYGLATEIEDEEVFSTCVEVFPWTA